MGKASFYSLVSSFVSAGNVEPVAGRRPSGLMAPRQHAHGVVADYLVRAAHLEAASVFAFDALAEELAHLGAPVALVEGCLRAARQETVHARVLGRLARARGAYPPAVDLVAHGRSSLFQLALENAVEGVVRQSYGALQARFCARRAADLEARAALAAIAEDEAAHASLARRIAEWLTPLLSPEERTEVARAQAAAIEVLRAELAREPAYALKRELGVPSRAEAARLLDQLARSVGQAGGSDAEGEGIAGAPRSGAFELASEAEEQAFAAGAQIA